MRNIGYDREYIPGNDPSNLPPIDTSYIKNRYMDLSYAEVSSSQKLDLYLPDNGIEPFPLIIHIHGGAFSIGDKCDIQLKCLLEALDRGFALASINYRLSGEAVFPAAYHDCKTAVRWLRSHATKYRLDPDKFGVIGGSAGGTLAAMLATSGNVPKLEGSYLGYASISSRVQCCVDWFGPIEFESIRKQLEDVGYEAPIYPTVLSPESRMLGEDIAQAGCEKLALSNPATHVDESLPPILIQHGSKDFLVPWLQSKKLADTIQKRLGANRVTFELVEDAGHMDPLFETPENMKKVFTFFCTALKC